MRIPALRSILTSPIPVSNSLLADAAQAASRTDPLSRIAPVATPREQQPGLRMSDGSPMKSYLYARMQRMATDERHPLATAALRTERNGSLPDMPMLRLAASAPLQTRSLSQENQLRFFILHAGDNESANHSPPKSKTLAVNVRRLVTQPPRRRNETRRSSATERNNLMDFDGLPKIENKNSTEDSVTGSISPYVTVPVGDPLPLSKSTPTLSKEDFLRRNPAGIVFR
jgi:hypothetical protein